MYSTNQLTWKGDVVYLFGRGKPIIGIVRDAKYPTMWRVELPDGKLSDMVNRTRAKDATNNVAVRLLNKSKAREAASEAALVR